MQLHQRLSSKAGAKVEVYGAACVFPCFIPDARVAYFSLFGWAIVWSFLLLCPLPKEKLLGSDFIILSLLEEDEEDDYEGGGGEEEEQEQEGGYRRLEDVLLVLGCLRFSWLFAGIGRNSRSGRNARCWR